MSSHKRSSHEVYDFTKRSKIDYHDETSDSNSHESSERESTSDSDSDSDQGSATNSDTTIMSWNINGLRAMVQKGSHRVIGGTNADIVCLQEIRCQEVQVPNEIKDLDGYPYKYYNYGTRKGYFGVCILTKVEPLAVTYGMGADGCESDGRVITAEFDGYYVVSVYALNAGQHLEKLDERHQWNRHFRKYVHLLDGQKAVIICGDFNVAHKDLDCSQWLNKPTTPGCSPRERHDFTRLLSAGFVDTYRHLYPDESDCYTTCSYGNWHNGWRFDYFLVSEQLMDNVRDSLIMQQMDRDHNPITLRVTG